MIERLPFSSCLRFRFSPRFRFLAPSSSICGPATPSSRFQSPGLGSSDFARHYSRNHGCFLFLRVLRWFTSPGSLRAPMCSAHDTECSHSVGSPIRTSPDHSVLTAPRSFSQLATSFFAFLCLGIPTHALSSLTIKFPNGCCPSSPPPVALAPSFGSLVPPPRAISFLSRFTSDLFQTLRTHPSSLN